MKLWLRACPKCGGDLDLQVDLTGTHVECFQCGLELNPAQERLLRGLGHVPHDQSEAVALAASGSPHHQVA